MIEGTRPLLAPLYRLSHLSFQFLSSFLAVVANRRLRAITYCNSFYSLNSSGLWPAVWTMGNLGECIYIHVGPRSNKYVNDKAVLGTALLSMAW